MAEEFKPITTQEEFDAAIKTRLARERATVEKQYADYEDLKAQVAKSKADRQSAEDKWEERLTALQKTVEEANGKIKTYEISALKNRIAQEVGLPAELTDRISGETEEELKKDAKALKSVFSAHQRAGLPGYKNDEAAADPKTAAMKELLSKIRKE
ncbi:MAG: DUF4355 domain-containing protein [Lachnospiraceae bacterium]|nr:DUF4355 domain-containing protein [Lachnospiraceae bacterium]